MTWMNLLYLFLGVTIVVFVLICLPSRFAITRKIDCPVRGKKAKVKFWARLWGGKIVPTSVRSCSLFDNPRAVRCDQDCVKTAKDVDEKRSEKTEEKAA